MNTLSFELLQLDEQASTVLWSAEPKVKKRVSEGAMPVPKTLIRPPGPAKKVKVELSIATSSIA
jgi:hypothetical protein